MKGFKTEFSLVFVNCNYLRCDKKIVENKFLSQINCTVQEYCYEELF